MRSIETIDDAVSSTENVGVARWTVFAALPD